MITPALTALDWPHQYRIIPTRFPPINFFEGLLSPDLMDELYIIESLTNDRLRDETGNITLIAREDRLSGPGSSPVMAAFTHIGIPSRFSDGSYGVYYASRDVETAIEETKYHRARFLSYTREDPGAVEMRVYIGEVLKPMHDVRDARYDDLHDPDDWSPAQTVGKVLRQQNAWGVVYRSVRHPGGHCIAALRPSAVSIPRQGDHLSYVWDGKNIATVFKKTLLP